MSKSLTSGKKIILRKHDSVGLNEAQDDEEYLLNCFVDLGDLDQIKDFRSKKCLILGRTGVGKTALITKLKDEKQEKVIIIDPEALAMRHISNSTIINYLVELDIDLNTFFKLLWRHEICVEIFTQHVKVVSETDHSNFIDKVQYYFKKNNPKHLKALEYLEQWKDTFWKTSDNHVSKMIEKTENSVGSSLGMDVAGLQSKIKGRTELSREQIQEIKQRGQSIVNDVQMKEVMGLLDMLDDFIEYHKVKYYIVIDRLDEKWVGNDIRYKLIKSLIETLRDLNRLQNIKPLATLRYDLIGRVFDISKDSGFQEEKYSSLFLNIRWNRAQLIRLIDERINYQFKHRYSKRTRLSYKDILPDKVLGVPTIDYIIDRTLMRPRDVIEFVNFCIECAIEENDGIIHENTVIEAEERYSRSRLGSLYYEWFSDYPGLEQLISLLKNKKDKLVVKDINKDAVMTLCKKYNDNPPKTDIDTEDAMIRFVKDVLEGKMDSSEFVKRAMLILFRVGLIGIKKGNKMRWSTEISPKIEWDDIDDSALVEIHPCYRKALGIAE